MSMPNGHIEVKVSPHGDVVKTVMVEKGSTIDEILEIAEVDLNGRSIFLNASPATLDTEVNEANSTIVLANKAKGGCTK